MPTTKPTTPLTPAQKRAQRDADIKAMTVTERQSRWQELVPGLREGALEIWIQTGKGFREQLEDFRKSELRAAPEDGIVLPASHTNHTQEATMATTTNTKSNTKSAPKTETKLTVLPITTTQVAEAAGVTPKQLRIFLRANVETFPKPEGQRTYGWKNITAARKLINAVKKEAAAAAKAETAEA